MSKKISISMIIFIIAIIALWIWTLAMPKTAISIGGSSSVDPIIQRLTNKYKKDNNKNFIYSSTGSQAGISNMQNGVYKIGFISKSVSETGIIDPTDDKQAYLNGDITSVKDYLEYVQKHPGVHYSTIANDSLVFIYNDSGMNFDKFEKYLNLSVNDDSINDDSILDEDSQEIIGEIYKADNPNDLMTWRELAQKILDDYQDVPDIDIKQADVDKVSTNKIHPYTTSPGSGTRSTFEKISNIKDKFNGIGSSVNIYNSNGSVFEQIQNSSSTFGYVSMSYAKYLADDSFSDNIKYMKVKDTNSDSYIDPIELYKELDSDPTALSNYPLTREFNALFDTAKLSKTDLKEVVNFIWYISTNEALNSDFKEEGLNRPWLQQK